MSRIEKLISETVIFVRDNFCEENHYTPLELNSGDCFDARDTIYELLLEKGIEVVLLDDCCFVNIWHDDEECGYLNPLDFGSLPKYDYKKYDIPAHGWIYYNGKHYDCECVKGVRNFFNLPLMKRFKRIKKLKTLKHAGVQELVLSG